MPVSIRASLQQRGELTRVHRFSFGWRHFNPRLTSAARRTPDEKAIVSAWPVFQSAPHFSSEANTCSGDYDKPPHVFQSAPHFSSEANIIISLSAVSSREFQSAPHFSSEANQKIRQLTALVSQGFNPRLTSAARRTVSFLFMAIVTVCFNPRLTSAARRTWIGRQINASDTGV